MRFIFCVELPWVCFVGNPEAHMKSSYSGFGNLNAGKSEQVSGDQPRPQLPHMFLNCKTGPRLKPKPSSKPSFVAAVARRSVDAPASPVCILKYV